MIASAIASCTRSHQVLSCLRRSPHFQLRWVGNGERSRWNRREKYLVHNKLSEILRMENKTVASDALQFFIFQRGGEFRVNDVVDLMHLSVKQRLAITPKGLDRLAEILASKGKLTVVDLSKALYGMKSFSSNTAEARVMLQVLSMKLQECPKQFKALEISSSLYGLQNMSSDCSEVVALLSAITEKTRECKEAFDVLGIGNALYGLKRMSSDCPEVLSLLSALVPKIEECRAPITAKSISNALYGLQGVSSRPPEVLSLLNVLATKVAECKEHFNPQSIGNSLYGLKRMTSDNRSVLCLISALSTKIAESDEALDPQGVGDALLGLQGMSSSCPEVLALLTGLRVRIRNCKEPLHEYQFRNAVYGLQNMSSDNPVVLKILHDLTNSFKKFSSPVRALTASKTLFGLQSMSNEKHEVKVLMDELAKSIKDSNEKFTGTDVGNALFGLQSMKPRVGIELPGLFSVLSTKIVGCYGRLNCHDLAIAIYGLSFSASNTHSVVLIFKFLMNSVKTLIDSGLKASDDHFFDLLRSLHFLKFQHEALFGFDLFPLVRNLEDLVPKSGVFHVGPPDCTVEKKVLAMVERLAIESLKETARVTRNEILHGFETDIVIRIPIAGVTKTGSGKVRVINIELEGPPLQRVTDISFITLRDAYLSDVPGVEVFRLVIFDNQSNEFLSDETIEESIRIIMDQLNQEAHVSFFFLEDADQMKKKKKK